MTDQSDHIAPRWIPVGESIPKPGQLCLVAVLDDYDLACYVIAGNDQFWHGWRFSYPLDVTHWQPLPDLPREADGATTLDAILDKACQQAKRGNE